MPHWDSPSFVVAVLDRLTISAGLLLTIVPGLRASDDQVYSGHARQPVVDIWMYGNNMSGGGRSSASTFSALPNPAGGDDRLAQVVVKFNTVAAGIPAGLGVANYNPTRVILTTRIADSLELYYDPTEDARTTFGAGDSTDTDAGRPFEVYGTGFRNGFTAANYAENSPFSSGNPAQRNAYALGYSPQGVARDVTNNVTQGFDAYPWAIGQVSRPTANSGPVPLQPGASVPIDAYVTFELNLGLPGVAQYVRQSFHQGFMWLTISSLHTSEERGSTGYPGFFNKESPEHALDPEGVAPQFDAEYTLPLRIAAFSRNGTTNACRVDWNGSPGFRYVVQRSTTLLPDEWTTLTPSPITTASPAQLFFEGAGSGDHSFFRVIRTPSPTP